LINLLYYHTESNVEKGSFCKDN